MDVKSVPKIQPYQIHTTTETRDEKNQNDRSFKKDSESETTRKKTPRKPISDETVEMSSDELSQLIPSETYVELLGKESTPQSQLKEIFSKLSSLHKTKSIETTPSQKLDKKY